jgi:hypothetical protein
LGLEEALGYCSMHQAVPLQSTAWSRILVQKHMLRVVQDIKCGCSVVRAAASDKSACVETGV